MGYTTKEGMVRVDFFKQSGKWYCTEEMFWDRYSSKSQTVELIHGTFRRCLDEQFPNHYKDMIAVCLKPYHENAHPLMINRLKGE